MLFLNPHDQNADYSSDCTCAWTYSLTTNTDMCASSVVGIMKLLFVQIIIAIRDHKLPRLVQAPPCNVEPPIMSIGSSSTEPHVTLEGLM